MLTLLLSVTHRANAQETQAQPAYERGSGAYILATSGLFVPPQGGALGIAVAAEVGYEVSLGHLSLGPGLRVAGYASQDLRVLAGLATLRSTVPLELFSLSVLAAVGPGYVHDSAKANLTYQLGAGLYYALGAVVSLGAEASFVRAGTRVLSLGPILRVHLGAS